MIITWPDCAFRFEMFCDVYKFHFLENKPLTTCADFQYLQNFSYDLLFKKSSLFSFLHADLLFALFI